MYKAAEKVRDGMLRGDSLFTFCFLILDAQARALKVRSGPLLGEKNVPAAPTGRTSREERNVLRGGNFMKSRLVMT